MTAIETPVEKDELLTRVAARPSIEVLHDEWFRRYYYRLVYDLRSAGASFDDASDHATDALTDVILRVQRGAPPPEFAHAYLAQSARRSWQREQVRRRRERALVLVADELDELAISTADDPFDAVMETELMDLCRQFLRPDDYKTVAMRVQGYRNEEIAQELGVSASTVRAGLYRARRVLGERLGYSPREAGHRETPGPALRDGREALDNLGWALRRLRAESGGLTVRNIAQRTGQQASYPTVHRAFQCHRLPRWSVVEAVVTALGGNVSHFWHLWADASGTPTPNAAAAA